MGETASVYLKQHLQQGAQGGRRYETPPAYGDYHGRELVNPFWRNLEITALCGVVIFSETRLSAKTVCREKAPGREGLTEDAMPL